MTSAIVEHRQVIGSGAPFAPSTADKYAAPRDPDAEWLAPQGSTPADRCPHCGVAMGTLAGCDNCGWIETTVSKPARDLKVGDRIDGLGTVTALDQSLSAAVIYVWVDGRPRDLPADAVYNHGDPVNVAPVASKPAEVPVVPVEASTDCERCHAAPATLSVICAHAERFRVCPPCRRSVVAQGCSC